MDIEAFGDLDHDLLEVDGLPRRPLAHLLAVGRRWLAELAGLWSPSVRGAGFDRGVRYLSGRWRAAQNGCCDRLRRP